MTNTKLPFEPDSLDEPGATALIHVRPDVDPRVLKLYEESVALLRDAEAQSIQSNQDVKVATDNLSIIARLKKAIEDKRKEYTVPLNDHLKAFNEAFKSFIEPLTRADAVTRKKVLDYRAELERVREEEERINRLREEAARSEMALKGELTETGGLVEVSQGAPAHHRTDMGTVGTQKAWQFEVVDFALLPDEYKEADMKKIRKVVIAGATIPGVRAWQEESLRVTPVR